MRIKVWTAIIDRGDGSHGVRIFPSEEVLREKLQLDEEDFQPGYGIPVEVDFCYIDLDDYVSVELKLKDS